MKTLRRNKQKIWYCTYTGEIVEILDENGNRTGEKIPMYDKWQEYDVNVSPATGLSVSEQFGNLDNYDKVLVTDDTNCPITESTVLFVDKDPGLDVIETHFVVPATALLADDEIAPIEYAVPDYDYIVRRVAKSLNSVSIAIAKVRGKH